MTANAVTVIPRSTLMIWLPSLYGSRKNNYVARKRSFAKSKSRCNVRLMRRDRSF